VFDFSGVTTGALLTYCDDAEVRKSVFFASTSLAHKGNTKIVLKMLQLRKELAKLL